MKLLSTAIKSGSRLDRTYFNKYKTYIFIITVFMIIIMESLQFSLDSWVILDEGSKIIFFIQNRVYLVFENTLNINLYNLY